MRKRMEMTSNCVKLLCIDTGAAPLLCHGETVSCGLRSSSSESEHVPNVSMEAAGKLCKSPQPCQPRLMPNTKNRTGSFCVVFIKWHGEFSRVMQTRSVVPLTLALTRSISSTPNSLNAFRSEKRKEKERLTICVTVPEILLIWILRLEPNLLHFSCASCKYYVCQMAAQSW